eukprot:10660356-Alexandrium_andersonii.AAC.1
MSLKSAWGGSPAANARLEVAQRAGARACSARRCREGSGSGTDRRESASATALATPRTRRSSVIGYSRKASPRAHSRPETNELRRAR